MPSRTVSEEGEEDEETSPKEQEDEEAEEKEEAEGERDGACRMHSQKEAKG